MNFQMTSTSILRTQLEQRAEQVELFRALWKSLIPVQPPTDQVFSIWISRYELGIIKFAFEETAKKYHRTVSGGCRDSADLRDYMHKYTSSVMRREVERMREKAA